MNVLERPEVVKSPIMLLNAHDRCQKRGCGAQAFYSAERDDFENELTFCGHHGAEVIDSLREQGFKIVDFTDHINPQPSPSNADI